MKNLLFGLKIFIVIGVPFIFMLSVFFTNINVPWRTVNEDNGYVYGSMARSHLILGLKKTFGQDFFYNGSDKKPLAYLHHPPGVGLTLAVILKFLSFGNLDEAYWQERLMPIIYHSASFFLLGFISYSFFKSLKMLFLSSWFFVLTPMSLYYGRMVSYEPPTLFFLILTSFIYLKYSGDKNYWKRYLFFIPLLFFCVYEWVGFYFIPVISFFSFKDKRFILNIILFEFLMILLIFGQIFIANNYSFSSLIGPFWQRTSIMSEGGLINSCVSWIKFISQTFIDMFTPIIGIPAFIYLLILLLRKILDKSKIIYSPWQKLALIFFCVALIHVFLWPNGARGHFFWQMYFIPVTVLAGAYIYSILENLITSLFPKGFKRYFSIFYYSIILLVVVLQSQPVTKRLYTGEGKFPFPNFYIENQIIK